MKRMNLLVIISVTLLAIMNIKAQNKDFVEMVKYAVKAPSGHNTQPWKFHLTDHSITIIPNFDDALPVVDGSHRELYISLGCATENLCIAATHFGYSCYSTSQDAQGIAIEVKKSANLPEDPLFTQIEKRQTNRSIYKNRKIPQDTLALINTLRTEANVHLYINEIGSTFADTLTNYITKGNTLQMSDKPFRKELMTWMRMNNKQINDTKNGLTYQTLGISSLPGFLVKPLVGTFMSSSKQNKTDLEKISSSSHLVLFTTKNNTTEEWISTGRSLERFLLKTTELGIANAYMNQPCEVESLAKEMKQLLPINNEFPTLILRIGYADPMPYSLRKDVEEVIEK